MSSRVSPHQRFIDLKNERRAAPADASVVLRWTAFPAVCIIKHEAIR